MIAFSDISSNNIRLLVIKGACLHRKTAGDSPVSQRIVVSETF